MDPKIYLPPSMGYMQEYAKDKKKLAQEFEAILLKEALKEGFKGFMNSKGFQQRLYYDAFLENLSRHLALNGGVGIAQFILKNLKD
jgi:Rod binding domain-containing protein